MGEEKEKLSGYTHRRMTSRICRVTLRDRNEIEHTVEVSAYSLYEAVALGLKTLRGDAWSAELNERQDVRVMVLQPSVEHRVALGTFQRWLAERGRSPADVLARARVREILGSKATGE